MKKDVKNIAASVRNKLINVAVKEQKDYNAILRLYFQERFLYRLSISPYKNKLILKGALLLVAKDISRFRPTRDIDFLGRALPNEIEDCKAIVSEIAAMAYSFESAIAEKFEAIVKLNILTSRMKDFYDIFFLASNIPFSSDIMKKALETTFLTRGTQIEDRAIIYENEFQNDTLKNTQWNIFLSKNKIELKISFVQVIEKIHDFIEPIFSNVPVMSWNFSKWQWETH
ncbi:MAG: nucleotidyl transferase AbiEii/AbiGii toxin family protein [Acidobacteriota bacterium]